MRYGPIVALALLIVAVGCIGYLLYVAIAGVLGGI